ncbi:hypothetical protein K458DRAFT_374053 [Lentithecium fluviatile CBS 122367]|uniref:RRM domain-containing protein n=1 Tax=Lentithecium fluviatile CBS 122367 TaxID=1168545 RepID=A0A6G1IP02_9PLEO|nr:hypothetical protein K458DRAFT_374053 [Lentithecium fluviatile CBS 122367]
MSGTDKLNSSLDDILKTTRSSTRRGRGGRRSGAGRRTSDAPVGGVQKPTKPTKPTTKAAPTTPAGPAGNETKIMISNLPLDVEENQLKDYFQTAVGVGRPKRILLQYGANGKSLGSATVIFSKADQANKASSALQGVKIDGRPIRVEVLVSAANVAARPQPSLAERVTQPKKDKPKPVAAPKGAADTRQGRGRGRGRGGRAGRGGREGNKKKTVEELDAEMEDYFPNADGNADAMVTNGNAATSADDANMVDEML